MQTKTIELVNGGTAIVDECDYESLKDFRWFRSGDGYAHRQGWTDGKHWDVFMHRVINNTPPGIQTDHRNRNRLDNRRENLRSATPTQQRANQVKGKPSPFGDGPKSIFKGVSFHHQKNRWRARISNNNKDTVTYHELELDAAFSYNQMATAKFGDYAVLNPIPADFVPAVKVVQKSHSKYRGVSKCRHADKWSARIYPNRAKELPLGHFDTELEAATAYNNAALELYGPRAKLNQI